MNELPLPVASAQVRLAVADIRFLCESLDLGVQEAAQLYLEINQQDVDREKARSEKGLTSVLGRIAPQKSAPPSLPTTYGVGVDGRLAPHTYDPGYVPTPPINQTLTPSTPQTDNVLEVLGKGG